MKKQFYLLEFIDGTIVVENNRTCLKNKIFDWCEKNGDYYLTDNQIDCIVYNRSNQKPKYIKYFGKCSFDELFKVDNNIKMTHKNNKPFTPNYILAIKRKQYNSQYNEWKNSPNRIDRNLLTTILSC